MTTEAEAIGIVKRNKGGRIEGCYGPSKIAGHEVWEIWTHNGNEYCTRFVSTLSTEEPQYCSSFGELCARMTKIHDAQVANITILSMKNHVSTVRLYVAAGVFISSVGVLLYLILIGQNPNSVTFAVLASLIASGGIMFYGAWRQLAVADLFHR